MFNSSVRRVVASSAPQAGRAALVSSAVKAVSTSAPVAFRGHQRRFSSSKPSSSDNGSSDISAGQSVPASTTSAPKSGSDKRKRKSKDTSDRDASFKRLPSVPNTYHMSEEGTLREFLVFFDVM